MGAAMESKQDINRRKLAEIGEALSTFEGRKKLLVGMWFPMDRCKFSGETEQQRVDRLYGVLVREAEAREKQYRRRDKGKRRSPR